MIVLDLFAGTGGFSQAFRAHGHHVISLDLDPRFSTDLVMDARQTGAVVAAVGTIDVLLASPPCNSFSTGSMGRMWHHGPVALPRHPTAQAGMEMVNATLRLIVALQPRWWAIENPRGRLRSLDLLAGLPRFEVWQCRLGKPVAKPTDIWTNAPLGDTAHLRCHNGHPDHLRAPRGSTTGTQGMGSIEAAAIPLGLSTLLLEGMT